MFWRAGGCIGPRKPRGITPRAVGTSICHRHWTKSHQTVVSQGEMIFPEAKEIEWIRNIRRIVRKVVVGVAGHAGTQGEGGVGRIVRDGVYIVGAVEHLHGDVGGAGQHDAVVFVCHHCVPAVLPIAFHGGVVVLLLDLYLEARRRDFGPQVFATIPNRRRCRIRLSVSYSTKQNDGDNSSQSFG